MFDDYLEISDMLLVAMIFLFIFPVYRALQIWRRRGRPIDLPKRRGNNRNVRVCAVLGSGGHTTEMVRIIKDC